MKILETLEQTAKITFNSDLDAAKKDGKKIIGYFCSYIPEELIHAAGCIPYRIRAVENTGTAKAETYFAPTICSYVRQCFDKALNEHFHFLDGVVFMNGCDHSRRLYDNWRYAKIKPDFLYMLSVPHTIADPSPKTFSDDLKKLIKAIETQFNVEITQEKLDASIKLYNRKRHLLSQIYESRKNKDVPITGTEILTIMLAITVLPIETAISMLEEVLDGLEGRVVSSEDDLRLYITGSCVEEVDHIKLIEESGGIVVADKICLGASHFDTLVEENEDPVAALAKRYLQHLSCVRMMDDVQRRIDYMHDKIKEYHVDAVIAERLEFCTLMAGEAFIYKKELGKKNFPILLLDRELYGGGTGQIRTRVQAFFEKVRNIKRAL